MVHSRAVRKPYAAIILSILKCVFHITWSKKLDQTPAKGGILTPNHPCLRPCLFTTKITFLTGKKIKLAKTIYTYLTKISIKLNLNIEQKRQETEDKKVAQGRSTWLKCVKHTEWFAVHCLVLSQSTRVTDRRMDRQTNRVTTPKTALS